MSPPVVVSNHAAVNGVTDTEAVTVPRPLTITGVIERRAKAPPFKAGVAASTTSDQFKSKVSLSQHRFRLEGLGSHLHCGICC